MNYKYYLGGNVNILKCEVQATFCSVCRGGEKRSKSNLLIVKLGSSYVVKLEVIKYI